MTIIKSVDNVSPAFKIATETNCGICDGHGIIPKNMDPKLCIPVEDQGRACYWCDATGKIYVDDGEELCNQLIEVINEFDDPQSEFPTFLTRGTFR